MDVELWDAVAIALLVAFFLMTVLCQMDSLWASHVRSWDLVGLIPGWSFFAPNPGRVDFHLLFRDELPGGAVTNWQEIPLAEHRRWHDFLWNPQRRLKKVLFDSFGTLSRDLLRGSNLQLSVPYLVLLSYVAQYPRLYPCVRTQFALMVSSPADPDAEPVEILMSERHER
ncbi:MAG: hypothetical protein ACKV0T_02830 [Planctomycetales bacterium]